MLKTITINCFENPNRNTIFSSMKVTISEVSRMSLLFLNKKMNLSFTFHSSPFLFARKEKWRRLHSCSKWCIKITFSKCFKKNFFCFLWPITFSMLINKRNNKTNLMGFKNGNLFVYVAFIKLDKFDFFFHFGLNLTFWIFPITFPFKL